MDGDVERKTPFLFEEIETAAVRPPIRPRRSRS